MSTQTCAERIEGELASRIEDIEGLLAALDQDEEDADSALWEYPYGQSEYEVVRIELSGGGPSDYIEVKHRKGEIEAITYHFLDWFDKAEKDVTDNLPIRRFVDYFLVA